MAVAIEDAGFEIRDQIMYVYGSGFPKSLNVKKAAKDKVCQCSVEWVYGTDTQGTQSQSEHDLQSMSDTDLPQTINSENKQGKVLLTQLQEQSAPSTNGGESKKGIEDGKESSVEGWNNTQESKGQLQGSEIYPLPTGVSADGSQRWLHNGTSLSDGSMDRQDADSNRSGQSQESQSIGQPQGKLGTLSNERGSQAGRSWKICGWCNKPIIDGWGTALKPAHEPIVVARKPLIGTVAANVLTYGTGGLNIDGTRVGDGEDRASGGLSGGATDANLYQHGTHGRVERATGGRWPANVIHDGSDEVVALFPDTKSTKTQVSDQRENVGNSIFLDGERTPENSYTDSGSAARFFYCAKASKRDRNEGLDGFEAKRDHDGRQEGGVGGSNPRNRTNTAKVNHHPTVKPTELMRYLCRLVTPPGGIVLDPFMGSGSTGKAAMYEGFEFVGIELTDEYLPIAKARIEFAIEEMKGRLL
jgi:hypothetical protein